MSLLPCRAGLRIPWCKLILEAAGMLVPERIVFLTLGMDLPGSPWKISWYPLRPTVAMRSLVPSELIRNYDQMLSPLSKKHECTGRPEPQLPSAKLTEVIYSS